MTTEKRFANSPELTRTKAFGFLPLCGGLADRIAFAFTSETFP